MIALAVLAVVLDLVWKRMRPPEAAVPSAASQPEPSS
jgi:hypothetical protein